MVFQTPRRIKKVHSRCLSVILPSTPVTPHEGRSPPLTLRICQHTPLAIPNSWLAKKKTSFDSCEIWTRAAKSLPELESGSLDHSDKEPSQMNHKIMARPFLRPKFSAVNAIDHYGQSLAQWTLSFGPHKYCVVKFKDCIQILTKRDNVDKSTRLYSHSLINVFITPERTDNYCIGSSKYPKSNSVDRILKTRTDALHMTPIFL